MRVFKVPECMATRFGDAGRENKIKAELEVVEEKNSKRSNVKKKVWPGIEPRLLEG